MPIVWAVSWCPGAGPGRGPPRQLEGTACTKEQMVGEEAAQACGDLGEIWSFLQEQRGSCYSAPHFLIVFLLLTPLQPCDLLTFPQTCQAYTPLCPLFLKSPPPTVPMTCPQPSFRTPQKSLLQRGPVIAILLKLVPHSFTPHSLPWP